MNIPIFNDFLISEDSLRVYDGDRLVFASNKDGLQPLLEYIDRFVPYPGGVKIFDKILGNAAALLSVKAGGQEVYSPLGSELAVQTLDSYRIGYHFTEVVPYIQRRNQQGMCPMEELSINKSPDEFYEVVRQLCG
ncbi:hypothetical protein ES703_65658 [subsurface metagenome]